MGNVEIGTVNFCCFMIFMGSVVNWRGKEEQIVDKASIALIPKLDKHKKIKVQISISHEDRPKN